MHVAEKTLVDAHLESVYSDGQLVEDSDETDDRVKAGEEVKMKLRCHVRYDPSLDPSVIWLKDDVELDLNDDRFSLTHTGQIRLQVLTNTRVRSDQGKIMKSILKFALKVKYPLFARIVHLLFWRNSVYFMDKFPLFQRLYYYVQIINPCLDMHTVYPDQVVTPIFNNLSRKHR